MVIRDLWQSWQSGRSLLQPWCGSVIFASVNSRLTDDLLGGERDVVMTVDAAGDSSVLNAFGAFSLPSTSTQAPSWKQQANQQTFGRNHAGFKNQDSHPEHRILILINKPKKYQYF